MVSEGAEGGNTYILLPTYGELDLVWRCVEAIEEHIGCLEPTILINYESDSIGLKGGGFTGACNRLMNMALSDPHLHGVYVVGNDTKVVTDDFNHKVLTYAQKNPSVGSIMFAERIPNDVYSRLPGGNTAFPIHKDNIPTEEDILDKYPDREIPYPMLAFAWIRGETLRQVGVLDERFAPGYYDDFDWGARAWLAGWATMWVPSLQFNHLRGHTMGRLYPNSGADGARKFYEKYPYLRFGQNEAEVLKMLKDKSVTEEYKGADVWETVSIDGVQRNRITGTYRYVKPNSD